MLASRNTKIIGLLTIVVVAASAFIVNSSSHTIDFNTEVKPILNKKCITCHGGVRRQSGFSLLFRSEALAKAKSGKPAIIPGDPDHSEMIRRLKLKDPEDRMPYKHEPLSEEEITTLTRWIKQGAQWGTHWAYVPVKEVAVPKPSASLFGLLPASKNNWVKNDIDYFIGDKLKQQKLQPSPEADPSTLIRRVSLDLTGLPPSAALQQQYFNNKSGKAYEQLVDSLLASPHFGERWATMWMDLARYADTKGYERDASRNIWHYRDWLIRAFNNDKPYNQFLVEQLAGDLLPNSTDDQLIATAFHRNTMTNDEGGTDNEEFRTAAIIDRVNTTWEGLMGTTFACVQCHSHPYDPFTHEEYYKFMAFFNDTRDEDTNADYPLLRHFSAEDSLKLLLIKNWLQNNGYPAEEKRVYRFLKTWQPAVNSIQADSFTNAELNDTKWLAFRNNAVARLKHIDLQDKSQLIYRYQGYKAGGVWTIHIDNAKGPVLQTIPVANTKGWHIATASLQPVNGVHDLFFAYTNPTLKKPEDNGMLFDWFYFTQPLAGQGKEGYDTIKKYYWQLLEKDVPTTPVMMDNPPDMHRPTHVFEKGNWLVKGEEVQPGVPHSLNPFPNKAPRNRLGMAQWLTSDQNPLTARTIVNRLWEQLYGTGLVETLEDLGTQGAEPTHKELLDYLAYQFMHEYNWSIKKLLREMVLSATYRQDSKVTKEALEKDPLNKYYARGARVRLSAEQIRDQALAISGLLSEKMYGASVMPWQPEGIWMSPWNSDTWVKSEGDDQYRRAVYTFWKRTAAYPSMITFDGVGREFCTARRIRTNTPLQALATLNDSAYLDMARHFAYRMQKEIPDKNDSRKQISYGYQIATLKPITTEKLDALENLYTEAREKFKTDKVATCDMIGEDNEHNNSETAALVVVANAILNLDELITKN